MAYYGKDPTQAKIETRSNADWSIAHVFVAVRHGACPRCRSAIRPGQRIGKLAVAKIARQDPDSSHRSTWWKRYPYIHERCEAQDD